MHIIDTHNHSLPGIDDGAKDLEMALAMLRVAEESGTKEIVLTPHHLNGAYTNLTEKIQQQAELLRQEAAKHNISIKLHTASEVHLVPETVEHLLEKKALTYCGHGKAVLVELPKNTIPTGVESIFSELIYNGITPIIAHPERNSSLRTDYAPLREWIAFGCKSQVTGQSCTGGFGTDLQHTTFKMISDGLVHLVASDAHRPRGRSPNLAAAALVIKQHYGDQVCDTLFAVNPARLIAGKSLLSLTVSKASTGKTRNRNAASAKRATNSKKRSWLDRLKNPR